MSIEINGGVLPEVTATAKNLYKSPSLAQPSSMPDKLPKIETQATRDIENSTFGDSMYNSRGFYYDNQLKNELISVSLHVNTVTEDGGITWKDAGGVLDSEGYKMEPLFRSLLIEDYQTAISNSWSEFGDDAIGNLFNQFKPYAPYIGHLRDALKEMNATEEAMKASGDAAMSTYFGRIMDKVTDVMQGVANEGANILNRSLIAQGARFSYYGGTGVGFGNLTMKFTVFANWGDDGEFKTVDSQLQPIYPYCFGKYVKFLDENGQVTGTQDKNLNANNLDIPSSFQNTINEFFGWQLPPAGFEAQVTDVDVVQKGTLKLKFGAFYAIDNLVVSDAQFNFSKQMVKVWKDGENDLSPLYCDVTLTFKPASKFTDNKLLKFINGTTMTAEREGMENILENRLKEEKTNNENYLQGKGNVY